MNTINGIDNEFEFVKYLNNKKIYELNPIFRELIEELYLIEDETLIIKCWRNHLKQKIRHIYKNKWSNERNKY